MAQAGPAGGRARSVSPRRTACCPGKLSAPLPARVPRELEQTLDVIESHEPAGRHPLQHHPHDADGERRMQRAQGPRHPARRRRPLPNSAVSFLKTIKPSRSIASCCRRSSSCRAISASRASTSVMAGEKSRARSGNSSCRIAIPRNAQVAVALVLSKRLTERGQIRTELVAADVEQRPHDTGPAPSDESRQSPRAGAAQQTQQKRLRLIVTRMTGGDDVGAELGRNALEELVARLPPGILERRPQPRGPRAHVDQIGTERAAPAPPPAPGRTARRQQPRRAGRD